MWYQCYLAKGKEGIQRSESIHFNWTNLAEIYSFEWLPWLKVTPWFGLSPLAKCLNLSLHKMQRLGLRTDHGAVLFTLLNCMITATTKYEDCSIGWNKFLQGCYNTNGNTSHIALLSQLLSLSLSPFPNGPSAPLPAFPLALKVWKQRGEWINCGDLRRLFSTLLLVIHSPLSSQIWTFQGSGARFLKVLQADLQPSLSSLALSLYSLASPFTPSCFTHLAWSPFRY